MNFVYRVYDRLSTKHKWQIVGAGDDMTFVKNLVAVECSKFKDWGKRTEFPSAQLGVIAEGEDANLRRDTLRPTHKMAMSWFKETAISVCEYELDEFMTMKNKQKLDEFFECMTQEGIVFP